MTIKEWLTTLANTNESSTDDSIKMTNALHRLGYNRALVIYGIVYLEGRGRPISIHNAAKQILDIITIKQEVK